MPERKEINKPIQIMVVIEATALVAQGLDREEGEERVQGFWWD